MTVHELNDVMVHWQDFKYRDYKVAVWDWRRQKEMDITFTGCSHPDKEISFIVSDIDDKTYFKPADIASIAKEMPSPFEEGAKAILVEDPNYSFDGIVFTRYFYKCEKTEKTFTTDISDTYSMCSYYCEKCKCLRKELEELKNGNQH